MLIRTVFMGTPEFAVESLAVLCHHQEFEVVGVITQPDRPAGRGQVVSQPPVKSFAMGHNLPVYQPASLREADAVEILETLAPHVIVVAAFGQILRQNVLDLPQYGCINVHASLLPRWRGAAPIQHAIRAGDQIAGVTIMLMDAGLDTGPTLRAKTTDIASDETGGSLHDKLAELGANILPETILEYVNGRIVPQPQPSDGATYAKMLNKSDGRIDWQISALDIDRHVRAYSPWPGTYTEVRDSQLKVIRGHRIDSIPKAKTGEVLLVEKGIGVQTQDGAFVLDVVQPSGRKEMTGQAYLTGHPDVIGMILA